MNGLIKIPKVEFNFNTPFEDVYSNTLNNTRGNYGNETFSSKLNHTKSEEKISICKFLKVFKLF